MLNAIVLLSIVFTIGFSSCCQECDLAGHATEQNQVDDQDFTRQPNLENTSNAIPTESECLSISWVNTNNPFEERGVFHNQFMDYFLVNYIENITDTVGYKQVCANGLRTFALLKRLDYNFLPDDSTACVNYIVALTSGFEPYYEYDCFEYRASTPPLNLGLSLNALNELDSLNDIIADVRDSVITLSQAISSIKIWESNLNVTSVPELERLYTAGSIARHSLYYWGCKIHYDDSLRMVDFRAGGFLIG